MTTRHPGRYPKPGEVRPAPLVRVSFWCPPEVWAAFKALHLEGETHGEAMGRIVRSQAPTTPSP